MLPVFYVKVTLTPCGVPGALPPTRQGERRREGLTVEGSPIVMHYDNGRRGTDVESGDSASGGIIIASREGGIQVVGANIPESGAVTVPAVLVNEYLMMPLP
jgi:hypothetical protein